MWFCWHPNRRAGVGMTRAIGPLTRVDCPDCPAAVYGFMCMPQLQTPFPVLEEKDRG